jgi:hypothetical protein
MKWFWKVSITRSEREKSRQISIFAFQCIANIYMEGWFKIWTSPPVWSEPDLAKSFYRWWPHFLHLPMDDHHLGCLKKIKRKSCSVNSKFCTSSYVWSPLRLHEKFQKKLLTGFSKRQIFVLLPMDSLDSLGWTSTLVPW